MKLLDTGNGNFKLKKTASSFESIRVAGLSLMPDEIICPWCVKAGCKELCLQESGKGVMSNVAEGRQRKTDFWHADKQAFLNQLERELFNFEKLCARNNVTPWVRLNVLSDIPYEKHGIPQSFPNLNMYDYTKNAVRLTSKKLPSNYGLMFSYSGKPEYQSQVERALKTDVPISVVFTEIPTDPSYRFLGRRVITGDRSDILNLKSGKVIIGLKYKRTRATALDVFNSDFVVDPNNLAIAA